MKDCWCHGDRQYESKTTNNKLIGKRKRRAHRTHGMETVNRNNVQWKYNKKLVHSIYALERHHKASPQIISRHCRNTTIGFVVS